MMKFDDLEIYDIDEAFNKRLVLAKKISFLADTINALSNNEIYLLTLKLDDTILNKILDSNKHYKDIQNMVRWM